MTEPESEAKTSRIDWESFYGNYRKPGYVPGFEITSKLGGGMFGLVYKARKLSIGRDYAIKFLKVDDAEVQTAVLAELESVRYFAQVDHPNLVSIEDRGEVDGIPYIVMAYAGSETLRTRLTTPPSDRRDLVGLCLQAGRGVQALHDRSLVHFDLKPANIFLHGNVARVGDYGLSKLIAQSRNTLSMGRGTPYYMAPEMLQRRGDARSDIYSLGIVLYECWTGEVPFQGDSEWEVLRKHETEPPRFPDSIPVAHQAVLARCLAKDPGDRFTSVAEMIEAARGAGAPAGVVPDPIPIRGPASGPAPTHSAARSADADPASDGDPYHGLRDAAKRLGEDARRVGLNARKIAAEKVAQAGKAAERAMEDAQRNVREAIDSARWWRRIRRSAKQRQRAAWMGLATRHRGSRDDEDIPVRRHPRRWPGLGVAAVVFLGFALFLARGESRRGLVAIAAPSPSPVADWQAGVTIGRPPVSVKQWPAAASQDLARGMRVLRSELTQWQNGLPTSIRDLVELTRPLPDYAVPPPVLEGEAAGRVRDAVMRLASAAEYDAALADELARDGYAAFTAAVAVLGTRDMTSPEHFRAAQQLNRFLSELTGVNAIQLHEDPTKPPSGRHLALNQVAAQQWRWFFGEMLRGDPERFELYRKALRADESR